MASGLWDFRINIKMPLATQYVRVYFRYSHYPVSASAQFCTYWRLSLYAQKTRFGH